MKYFDTYYFCSTIQYLMDEPEWEFIRTMADFTDQLSGCEREDFPKRSYLMDFIEFTVERILFEQNKYMAEDIEMAIEADGYDSVLNGKHKVFQRNWKGEYRYTAFEMAIIHYLGVEEKIRDWILEHVRPEEFEALDVTAEYTNYLEDNYSEVIENISKDVFHILFQNRKFLLKFNRFMVDVLDGKSDRVYIPLWVKNAVKYRDNGRCVMCSKDLTGLLETEKIREKQFDHIVPLEKGGLNDVANIQLMCQKCNTKKVQKHTQVIITVFILISERQKNEYRRIKSNI